MFDQWIVMRKNSYKHFRLALLAFLFIAFLIKKHGESSGKCVAGAPIVMFINIYAGELAIRKTCNLDKPLYHIYRCVFGKRNYRVLVRVSVCVCVCLCVCVCFCTITQ